jgi:four helix bundle protein
LHFADAILEVAAALPKSPVAGIIREQIARSGTSIGANIEESDGAVSKADTRRSFVIARKEAQETRYWLKLIARRWPETPKVTALIQESSEIINIVSAIISKLS